MKKCKRCELEKPIEFFSKSYGKYLCTVCKKCLSEEGKLKYKDKKNIINERCRKYYKNNIDVLLKKAKDYKRSKRNLNSKRVKIKILSETIGYNEKICTKCLVIKDKINFTSDNSKSDKLNSSCNDCKNIYSRNKKKKDPIFKLMCNLRSNISESIQKMKFIKKLKTLDIIGCTFVEFKTHIELKFKDGMCWENYGEWHLDHIVPISYAITEDDVYNLNHYTNFQPLWAKDNLSKGNRYIG